MWTPSVRVSAGFAYTMSSKADKKRKVTSRGSARRRAPQSTLDAQVEEITLPASSEVQAEPETIKENPGWYLLERDMEAECLYLKSVLGSWSRFCFFWVRRKEFS